MMTCQIALAAALLAPAQDAKPDAEKPKKTRIDLMFVDPGGAQAHIPPVYEQIEVMRALLIRKLTRTVGSATQPGMQPLAVFDTNAGPSTSAEIAYPGGAGMLSGLTVASRNIATPVEPPVEGAYLDGYGVLFTVTLPPTNGDPRPGATGSKESPALSDWDREQRRLRGEPLPEKTAAPKTTPVGHVLLNLLAQNGKHFTALKDDERVTIAVTFRVTGYTMPTTTSASGFFLTHPPSYGPGRVSGEPAAAVVGRDREELLLGELHLRQGQTDQAIEAFNKAIARAENDPRALADIYTKLAQALTAANKLDEARAILDKVKALRDKAVETANPAAPPGHKPAAVLRPARLTVSTTKKLLDQVGTGKISMNDFREQVSIEYVPAG